MQCLDQTRERILAAVSAVKESTPLAGSITNYVTIDFVANAQLAAGGSAAMVYLPDEGEALGAQSGAFYINVGTLLPSHEEAMCRTATALCEHETPWVLDPVGIGLGEVRGHILAHMKEHTPTIIRCNASEVIALARLWGLEGNYATSGVKGVDSTDSVDGTRDAAIALARHIKGAVAVSGPIDLITDGKLVAHSQGGSPLMEKVTGFGLCTRRRCRRICRLRRPLYRSPYRKRGLQPRRNPSSRSHGRTRKLQGRIPRRAVSRHTRRHRRQSPDPRGGLA